MRPIRIVTAFAVLTAASSANAQAANLFPCRATGSFAWGCVLDQQRVLSEPMTFEGSSYQSEYRVVYDFPCTGHNVMLGLAGDQGFVPLQQSARNATAVVVSSAPLRLFDPDPSRTAGLTFQGECRLQVRSVDVGPSHASQQAWANEAGAQAQVVRLLSQLYLLARDAGNAGSWSREKLTLLRDRMQQLAAADPRNLQYRVLLETVVSAIEQAPPPYTEGQVAAASANVTSGFRADLLAQVVEGDRMVRRFEAWGAAVEATLQAALREIPYEYRVRRLYATSNRLPHGRAGADIRRACARCRLAGSGRADARSPDQRHQSGGAALRQGPCAVAARS